MARRARGLTTFLPESPSSLRLPDRVPPPASSSVCSHRVDGIWESAQKYATHLPILHGVAVRILCRTFDRKVQFQENLDAEIALLGLVPGGSPVGFRMGLGLDIDAIQELRSFASSSFRTSLHGRPGFGSARYLSRRFSRIPWCSAGNGTRFGSAAMRSQSSCTNSIRFCFGTESNSGGTVNFVFIRFHYRVWRALEKRQKRPDITA